MQSTGVEALISPIVLRRTSVTCDSGSPSIAYAIHALLPILAYHTVGIVMTEHATLTESSRTRDSSIRDTAPIRPQSMARSPSLSKSPGLPLEGTSAADRPHRDRDTHLLPPG
jgi:hypothetical protein